MMNDAAPTRISLPDSLLKVESVEAAVEIYWTSGLRPILIHAPTENGGCTCGKVHDTTASGSSSTGKHPIQSNWQKQREITFDEFRNQLARLKFTPNVGIVLGKQPDSTEYLIAIDVDDAERIAKLEEELGALPETPRCDSGRGYRLFYSAPAEIDVDRLGNVTGLGGEAGVDVKVEGGQVVVAPSLHANGKRYTWTVVGTVTPLPIQWAMQLLKKLETPKSVEKYTPAQINRPGHIRNRYERYLEVAVTGEARALAACGQGMRNNTLFKSACRLFKYCGGMHLSHKWQWVHDELLRAAKSAGLPDNESRKTLASADRTVRESGEVKTPMVLADPAPSAPPGSPPPEAQQPGAVEVSPAPSDDPWMLAPSSQGRPVIKISYELHNNVDEAIRALRADENLYQRETKLVCVTRVSREQSDASPTIASDDGQVHHQLVEGTPQICELEMPTVRERLTRVAVFQKWVEKQQGYVSTIPTDEIVGAVHKRKQWGGIRSIVGVIETPTMRPDGMIVQTPGYDPITRYVYIPSESFPEVRDEMATQSHARWAFSFLSEVFSDFPYSSDAHRSVPISTILTLVARPSITGSVPAFLFDASTRGSGKTLQTDAISMITTGRVAPRMNYSSDEVELEKILAGYALKGSSFICLDNVPTMRPFGGGPLDRCITARGTVDLRVLGRSAVPTLTWRAVVMATGNNMALYGDTARRVLMARLEPTEESPERRTKFLHNDLLEWVRAQRPRLVSAALLILRAYYRSGRPDMGCDRWGSFEEWSRLIPHAIVFAGGADPMLSRPEHDEDVDVETQALSCLLSQLPLLHARIRIIEPDIGDAGLATRSIVAALYEQSPEWPEFEPLRDAVETLCRPKSGKAYGKPDATSLGYKFRAMRSRVIGGKKLVGHPGSAHVTLWRVEKAGG